jgi:hypothetical protein
VQSAFNQDADNAQDISRRTFAAKVANAARDVRGNPLFQPGDVLRVGAKEVASRFDLSKKPQQWLQFATLKFLYDCVVHSPSVGKSFLPTDARLRRDPQRSP